MILKRLFIFLFLLIIPLLLFAQSENKQDNQKEEQKLEEKINTLQDRIKELEQYKEDQEIKALLQEADGLSREEKKEEDINFGTRFFTGARKQSGLNPNLTLECDMYAAYGKSKHPYNTEPSEFSQGSRNFFLREFELNINAPLDPYTRAKVFISYEGDEVSIEEGYMIWLNCPLNMNLKAGEFKAQFGKFNRWHDHALPQFDKPRVLVNFFGNTSLKGFGVAGNFLLPSLFAKVNELDLEVIRGGMGHSFQERGDNLIFVSHLKNYYDLSKSTYFEMGFSAALGKSADHEGAYNAEKYNSLVGGADLTLSWFPPERAKYRSLEWRSEILYSKRETPDEDVYSWGAFTSLEYRLSVSFLTSVRLDYSQLPWNNDLEEKGIAATLDFWQSEFVRVRLQYSYIDRNFAEGDSQIIFQTSWALGPHKHEKY